MMRTYAMLLLSLVVATRICQPRRGRASGARGPWYGRAGVEHLELRGETPQRSRRQRYERDADRGERARRRERGAGPRDRSGRARGERRAPVWPVSRGV